MDYTPSGDLDHEDLDKALHHAETLCSSVNEGVRQKENTEHLEWLQTHVHFTLDENLIFNSHTNFLGSRKLLHWGKLFKVCVGVCRGGMCVCACVGEGCVGVCEWVGMCECGRGVNGLLVPTDTLAQHKCTTS